MSEQEKKLRDEVEAELNKPKVDFDILPSNKVLTKIANRVKKFELTKSDVNKILRQPKKPRSGNKDIHSISNDYQELSYVAKKFGVPVSFVMRVKEDLETNIRVKIYIEIKRRLNKRYKLVWVKEIKPFSY